MICTSFPSRAGKDEDQGKSAIPYRTAPHPLSALAAYLVTKSASFRQPLFPSQPNALVLGLCMLSLLHLPRLVHQIHPLPNSANHPSFNAIRVVKSISPQEERSMRHSKAVLPTDTLPFAVL